MVVEANENGIPVALPGILKSFTKAAIRTQPKDLLAWSHAYFKAMCDDESPPVKEYLEFPIPETDGITPGILKVIHNKLSPKQSVPLTSIRELCQAFGIDESTCLKVWDSVDTEANKKPWKNLLIGFLPHVTTTTSEQLATLIQVISDDHVSKKVYLDDFMEYFPLVINESDELYDDTVEFLKEAASYQDGMISSDDILRPNCPLAGK